MLTNTKTFSIIFSFSSLLLSCRSFINCPPVRDFDEKFSKELSKASILDLLTEKNKIGEGAMGSVFKVPWIHGNKQPESENFVAVKKAKDEDTRSQIAAEIELLQGFNRFKLKHVAKYFGCFLAGKELHLVMQYLPFSLETEGYPSWWKDKTFDKTMLRFTTEEWNKLPAFYEKFLALPAEKRLEIYSQLAEGLAEMHDLGFVHHDIKPENLAFDSETGLNLKIIDFGLTLNNQHKIIGGSQGYFDKEKHEDVIKKIKPDQKDQRDEPENQWKADIWAFGVTVFELENSQDGNALNFLKNSFSDSAKKMELVRNKVTDRSWFVRQKIDICSPNKVVCFYDVMKAVMEIFRKDRNIYAKDIVKAIGQILGNVPESNKSECKPKKFFYGLFDILLSCGGDTEIERLLI